MYTRSSRKEAMGQTRPTCSSQARKLSPAAVNDGNGIARKQNRMPPLHHGLRRSRYAGRL